MLTLFLSSAFAGEPTRLERKLAYRQGEMTRRLGKIDTLHEKLAALDLERAQHAAIGETHEITRAKLAASLQKELDKIERKKLQLAKTQAAIDIIQQGVSNATVALDHIENAVQNAEAAAESGIPPQEVKANVEAKIDAVEAVADAGAPIETVSEVAAPEAIEAAPEIIPVSPEIVPVTEEPAPISAPEVVEPTSSSEEAKTPSIELLTQQGETALTDPE